MVKIKILALAAAFLLTLPAAAFAHSHNGRDNGRDSNSYDGGYYGGYYGSNIPGPDTFVDYQNTIPWFNPPYEPYQYKFHAFPNGDFYFSTPGNNYLPYISSGSQIRPLDYGALTGGYYQGY